MIKDCDFPLLCGTSAAQSSPAGKLLEVDGGRSSRSLKLALILRVILDLWCLRLDAFEVRVVRKVALLIYGGEWVGWQLFQEEDGEKVAALDVFVPGNVGY